MWKGIVGEGIMRGSEVFLAISVFILFVSILTLPYSALAQIDPIGIFLALLFTCFGIILSFADVEKEKKKERKFV